MLSLWPWHHSRLWIINRGPDPNADGLFVGKQGAISLSRQLGLMARHKYIKRGIAAISSDLNFGPSRSAIVGTFGLSGPRSPVKGCCSGASLCKRRASIHSLEVCVFEGSGRTFDVSHQHYQYPQHESTVSAQREEVKIRRQPHLNHERYDCFLVSVRVGLCRLCFLNFKNTHSHWANTHKNNS